MLAHPTRPGVVVALASTTLYVSRNGGRSFTPRLLGFFPKLYRNDGFVGTFAGDTLVVSGSWGPERKLGVAATIQKDGGLIASGDLGQSWTWYPTSLTSVAIGAVDAGDGQLLVSQRVLEPDSGRRRQSGSRSVVRLARPGAARGGPRAAHRRSSSSTPVDARCAACRACWPARPRRPPRSAPPAIPAPSACRRSSCAGRPRSTTRYACRTIARTPQGIALTTSPAKAIPRRRP